MNHTDQRAVGHYMHGEIQIHTTKKAMVEFIQTLEYKKGFWDDNVIRSEDL